MNDLQRMAMRLKAQQQQSGESAGNALHSLSAPSAPNGNPTYGGAVLGPSAAAGMQQAGIQAAMQGAKSGMGALGLPGALLGGAAGYAYGQANSFGKAMEAINQNNDPIGAAAKAFGWADVPGYSAPTQNNSGAVPGGPEDNQGGGWGDASGIGGASVDVGYDGSGYDGLAKGGQVTPDRLHGPDPIGPDDGFAALDVGEFVLTADVARREGRDKLQALLDGRARIVMV